MTGRRLAPATRVRALQRASATMKTLHALALVPLVVSCHFDKLFTGGGDGQPLSHGTPVALAFTAVPRAANAGQPISPPVRVAVVDSTGTPVAGAGHLITITLNDHPVGATLGGTDTAHAANGFAEFRDLRIDTPGNNYSLTASGDGLLDGHSNSFDVMPPPSTTGDLKVTTTTTGDSPDQNGYTATLDGGASQSIPPTATGSVTFPAVASGSHTVDLSDIAANCTVSPGTSQTVNVPAGGTGTAAFAINCPTPAPANQPPTVDFTWTCTGLTCDFTSISTDPDGFIAGYSWNFGDGSALSTAQNPSHTYGGDGTYTVTLTANDNQGATNSASHGVQVQSPPPPNRAPIVDPGVDQRVLVGALFELDGASFSDPDHDAPWTVTIEWGDGSSTSGIDPSEGPIVGSHSYPLTPLPHDYHLTVTVEDAHGARTSATKTVTVYVI